MEQVSHISPYDNWKEHFMDNLRYEGNPCAEIPLAETYRFEIMDFRNDEKKIEDIKNMTL